MAACAANVAYTLTTSPSTNAVTMNIDAKPSIVITLSADDATYADLDKVTTTITIDAADSFTVQTENAASDVFLVTWRHVC